MALNLSEISPFSYYTKLLMLVLYLLILPVAKKKETTNILDFDRAWKIPFCIVQRRYLVHMV